MKRLTDDGCSCAEEAGQELLPLHQGQGETELGPGGEEAEHELLQ